MDIEDATHLWLEAGDMSGAMRNHLEFSDDIAEFFDAESRSTGRVFIAYDSKVKSYCNLVNRVKKHGPRAGVWRLGLIPEDKGGLAYPGKIIHLEKRIVGKMRVYVIEVLDSNSLEHQTLLDSSVEVGETGGDKGRDFGFW